MRAVSSFLLVLYVLSTHEVSAKTFPFVGKALICSDGQVGEQNLDELPAISPDGTAVGVVFKFYEDTVEVYSNRMIGFVKSKHQPHYKETGRHLIWIESAYVKPSYRMEEERPVITRKHTLNRFLFTKHHAVKESKVNDGEGDWVPTGLAASSCVLTTHDGVDQKVEEMSGNVSK